jgi:hypothetical protein
MFHSSLPTPLYWFGLAKKKLESFPDEQVFIVFVCGTEDLYFVIPGKELKLRLEGIETSKIGEWKFHIYPRSQSYQLKLSGKRPQDISYYMNNYRLIKVEGQTEKPDILFMNHQDDGAIGNLKPIEKECDIKDKEKLKFHQEEVKNEEDKDTVSISNNYIKLSKFLIKKLNNPQAVDLAFSRSQNVVRIKPSYGSGVALMKDRIFAKQFFKHFQIKPLGKYVAQYNVDALYIDVSRVSLNHIREHSDIGEHPSLTRKATTTEDIAGADVGKGKNERKHEPLKTMNPDDIIAWLVTQPNANGTLYLENVARSYISALRSAPPKLALSLENRDVFSCHTVTELDALWDAFRSASNYKTVNSVTSGSLSAGLAVYGRYLEHLSALAENINSDNLVTFPQSNIGIEAADSVAATVIDDEYLYGLRDEFRNYIRQQHPEWADSTVDMHKSDAYFLKNNDVGISLTEAIANEEALLVARDKIRDYLRDVSRVGNPESGANGYLRTLRMLKEYLSKRPAPVTALSKDNLDLAVIENVTEVISTCFVNGFRLNSPIELARFRTLSANDLDEEISLSDEELKKYIAACGTTFGGKVYFVSIQTKERIRELAEEYFADGAQAIFYAKFYANSENWLFDASVISEDMLVGILRGLFPKLYFTQAYFGYTNESIFNILESEILRVWGDDVLLTYGHLAERLQYVPIERIKYALGQNADFIWNNAGEFTHVSKVDITEEESTEIALFAEMEIKSHKYVSIAYIPLGEIPENNYELSVTAIHNAVFHICLSRDYEQHGKIITRKGDGIDAKYIMEEHCRTLDRCTLDDLLEFEKDLTGECHRWIPMEAGYAVMVRTGENAFVAEKYIDFYKGAIDKAVDQFMNGEEYIPLRAVTTFALFPHCRHPWNLFLLESYCRRFSDYFRFEALSVNSTNAGVIVRKHSRLTYPDIITDAVAKSGIILDEKTVLNFLAISGYTSQRRYSKIVELIKQATALRA